MSALVSGSAHPDLARAIAGELDHELTAAECSRFPDGETGVWVDPAVRDDDVYLVQPLAPPVDSHMLELALLADACGRADCARITAVLPYFCYARQDRRTREGEAVGARVVADLLGAAGVDRALVVDPHSVQLEALCSFPLDTVSAVDLLAEGLDGLAGDPVVVAPDLGAVRRANRLAARLDVPAAFVAKTRLSGRRVEVETVVGDVGDRTPIIVDDMISTGGTIGAALEALRERGCTGTPRVVATHGLFVDGAPEILEELALQSVTVTDTLPQARTAPFPKEVRTVAPLLAAAIGRLVREEPLGELAAHG